MYIATGYLTVGGRDYTPGEIIREDIDEERKAFYLRAGVLRESRGDGEGRKASPAPVPEKIPETPARETASKAKKTPETPPEAEEDEEAAVPPEVGAEEVVVRKGRKRK